MGSESDLYSATAGARYMQCLEAFSYRSMTRDLAPRLARAGVSAESYFERAIKLHALFGGRIVITSVTPVGSVVLLSLFAKPDFRRFIGRYPSFLEMCCNFNRDIPEREMHLKERRVLAGIRRTLDSDWTSSMFTELPRSTDTSLIRAVSQAVLESMPAPGSGIDLQDVHERVDRSFKRLRGNESRVTGRHVTLLQAIPHVLQHFMKTPSAKVYRARAEYQTIRSMVSQGLDVARHPEDLLSVLNYIDDECGAEASFSEIIAACDQADIPSRQKDLVLQTACYAYNGQLIEAVGPAFGSYIHLPHGIPVGLTTAHFHNVMSMPPASTSDESLWSGLRAMALKSSQLVGFDCDIDSVGWDDIAEAMSHTHIARTAVYFQDHLHDKRRDDSAAAEVLRSHCSHLARFFSERGILQRPSSSCVWTGGTLAGAALGFVIAVGLHASNVVARVLAAGAAGGRASLPMTNLVQRWTLSETMLREAKGEFSVGGGESPTGRTLDGAADQSA